MKHLFIIIAILFSKTYFGQAQLGMSPNYTITGTYTSPLFTVNYFTVLGFNCYIKNKGNAVFTGTVNFNADTLMHIGTPLFFSNPYNNVTLQPGDSIAVTGNIPITPTYFQRVDGGGVTVVVWPKAANVLTHDSLFFNVFVKSTLIGLEEKQDYDNKITLFPNPCENKLFIKNDAAYSIERISIFDMLGNELLYNSETTEVDVSELPNGLYWLSILSKETTVRIRFLKQ